MSNLEEINQCVKIYKKYSNNNYVLLHCVSNYPCSLKSLNLKAISLIKERFKTKVGYSDHSNGNLAAVASVVLGASVVENILLSTEVYLVQIRKPHLLQMNLVKW